jgi:DNA-nicking Smr family endonuclease
MPKSRGENRRPPRDAGLWQDAVRGVAPLRRRPPAAPPAASIPLAPIAAGPIAAGPIAGNAAVPSANRTPRRPEPPALDRFAGIDRATAERLKRGLRAIEGRLDLHGMTQAEAHRALAEFVRTSSEAGRRCVLVITGRGLGTDGPGILKSSVPRWLGESGLRRQILAVAAAQPRHGGAGALYVLLRRGR